MSNVKITKQMENISDEEISQYMNFNSVLDSHKALMAAKKVVLVKFVVGVTIFAGITLAGWVCMNLEPSQDQTTVTSVNKKKTPVVPTTKEDSNKLTTSTLEIEKMKSKVDVKISKSTPISLPLKEKKIKEDGAEVEFTDAMPEGGYNVLYQYFDSNLIYPQIAKEKSIEGTVVVEFFINTKGKPEELTIIKSVHPLLDEEALRLIREMPDWKAAAYGSKSISTKKTIPLTFKLTKP